jgi:F-type H+-transporting ATPase subunit b
MRIDWATLALQTVNLAVLIALLSRFLFRPVADLLAKRRAEAVRHVADAEAQRAEAARTRAALDAEAAALAGKRAQAMQAAAEAAETERRKLVQTAETKAAEIVEAARAAAQQERAADAAATERRAAELALDIAAKLVARLPPATRTRDFLDGLVTEVAALPASVRADMAAAPLRLTAAADLDAETRAAARAALSQALGAEVAPAFAVDPALIAGLELEGPHVRVRNHLRGDLDLIAKTFAGHDA